MHTHLHGLQMLYKTRTKQSEINAYPKGDYPRDDYNSQNKVLMIT